MSIYMMHENHTFTRLDEMEVGLALSTVKEKFTGHGFVMQKRIHVQ